MAGSKPSKKKIEEPEPGVPEWVVTYGDMMSLLLTFFIMLVSLSELKEDGGTRRAMMESIRQAFGPTSGRMSSPGTALQENSAYDKLSSEGIGSDGGRKKSGLKSKGLAGKHESARRINHGTVITLGGPTRFAPFEAKLPEALKDNLDVIAKVVGPKANRIMVRGHAAPEPLPAKSPFADQTDLSYARARAVAAYLVTKGIDRHRLVVSAAGEAEPRLRTREKEGQNLNRRVDVFLIDSYITHPRSPVSAGR